MNHNFELTFISVALRNFLSFGNNLTLIPLNEPGTTLIVGENLDNTTQGNTSNGCGKSTIINAIIYALYGEPLSDIKLDNLVNNINERDMEVTVEFIKNNIQYKIKRERKTKQGNNIFVYINGEDKTEAGTADKQIAKIIGLPYELFVRSAVFSDLLPSFLNLKTSEQNEFMEELFSITMLSEKAENLKELIKTNESNLKLIQVKIEHQEREHVQLEQQKEKLKKHISDWESSHIQNINTAKLSVVKSQSDYDLAIENANAEIVTYTRSYESLDDTRDYEQLKLNRKTLDNLKVVEMQLKQEQSNYKKDLLAIDTAHKTTKKKINELTNELVELKKNQCPYCHQEFLDTKTKIDEINSNMDKLFTTLEDIEKSQTQILADEQSCAEQYNELLIEMAAVKDAPTFEQIANWEREPEKRLQLIEQAKQKLENLLKPNNPYSKLVDTAVQKISEVEQEVNPYIEMYDELLNTKLEKIDYTEIDDINTEIFHQKFLLKLLTKKDSFIRKAILNKSIPFLNKRLHQYLQTIGMIHKVEFMHDLSAKISLYGKNLNFGQLSAGQRARVNIALSMAFRDVLQHNHFSMNIWFLDEILDHNLDNQGVNDVAKLIKQKAKEENIGLYIVSHRDEIHGILDKTMTVQMIKGFSYIK